MPSWRSPLVSDAGPTWRPTRGNVIRIALLRRVAVAALEAMRPDRREPLLADRDAGGVPGRSSARSRQLDQRWWHGGLGPPEGAASCRVMPGVSSVRVCKTVG